MNPIERRHEISQIAMDSGRVKVKELSERLAVSEVTIRADLRLLEQRGSVQRVWGGATATKRLYRELSLDEKYDKQANLKLRLARRLREFINDGDSLILDSGSTTEAVSSCLTGFKRLKVLTNGLNIAQSIAGNPDIELLMTGGVMRQKSQSFYGTKAEESLSGYHFDKLILGVDGYDLLAGATTYFEPEATLNRKMCQIARSIIVITDSSKFDRSGLHKIREFGEIDVLITDSGIPDRYQKEFRKRGVSVFIVDVDADE